MKRILRVLSFVLVAVFATQSVLPFFTVIGGSETVFLFVLLLFLLFIFKRAVLKTISLPYEGLIYLLISFVLTAIIIHVFTIFFPNFQIDSAITPNLLIFGFVITSYHLSKLWTGVLAALFISLIYNYLDWVSRRK